MSTTCPDCNGKRTYQGFNSKPESCNKCNGSGKLGVRMKIKPSDLNPCANTKYDRVGRRSAEIPKSWFVEANKKVEDNDKIHLSPVIREVIMVGTIIYVYDAGWASAQVVEMTCNPNDPVTSSIVHAETPYERFRIPRSYITFNLTQHRWEYIRSGTPVWP